MVARTPIVKASMPSFETLEEAQVAFNALWQQFKIFGKALENALPSLRDEIQEVPLDIESLPTATPADDDELPFSDDDAGSNAKAKFSAVRTYLNYETGQTYSTTSVTTTRSINPTTITLEDLGHVVGTLLEDLDPTNIVNTS